jgi:hypothetical protein
MFVLSHLAAPGVRALGEPFLSASGIPGTPTAREPQMPRGAPRVAPQIDRPPRRARPPEVGFSRWDHVGSVTVAHGAGHGVDASVFVGNSRSRLASLAIAALSLARMPINLSSSVRSLVSTSILAIICDNRHAVTAWHAKAESNTRSSNAVNVRARDLAT